MKNISNKMHIRRQSEEEEEEKASQQICISLAVSYLSGRKCSIRGRDGIDQASSDMSEKKEVRECNAWEGVRRDRDEVAKYRRVGREPSKRERERNESVCIQPAESRRVTREVSFQVAA